MSNQVDFDLNSFCFHGARSLLPASLEANKTNFENLIFEFKEWLRFTKNRVIVLRRISGSESENKDKKVLVLEWKHRWKKSYMKEIKKRFSGAIDWYLDFDFIHIVLTVPNYGDIGFYMRKLKKAWKSLLDFLNKRKGRFEFISVLEPQKSGYPHLHVLIFCKKFLIKQRELSEYVESKGIGKICFIKRYWANRYGKRPLFYLMKYLSKYWKTEEWNDSFLIFSAYLWKSRTRTISTSRGFWLIKSRVKDKEKEWIFWFVCDFEEIFEILNEGGIYADEVILPRKYG